MAIDSLRRISLPASVIFLHELIPFKDCSDCGNITNEGITALVTGCPQLQSLNISGSYSIADEGREIAKRVCKTKQY